MNLHSKNDCASPYLEAALKTRISYLAFISSSALSCSCNHPILRWLFCPMCCMCVVSMPDLFGFVADILTDSKMWNLFFAILLSFACLQVMRITLLVLNNASCHQHYCIDLFQAAFSSLSAIRKFIELVLVSRFCGKLHLDRVACFVLNTWYDASQIVTSRCSNSSMTVIAVRMQMEQT